MVKFDSGLAQYFLPPFPLGVPSHAHTTGTFIRKSFRRRRPGLPTSAPQKPPKFDEYRAHAGIRSSNAKGIFDLLQTRQPPTSKKFDYAGARPHILMMSMWPWHPAPLTIQATRRPACVFKPVFEASHRQRISSSISRTFPPIRLTEKSVSSKVLLASNATNWPGDVARIPRRFFQALYRAFIDTDASLLEIIPACSTGDGNWWALIPRLLFDDNAFSVTPNLRNAR